MEGSNHWFSGFWNESEKELISVIFPGRFDEPLVWTAPHPSIIMNHVYPISESHCSHTSITIQACTSFPIKDGAFYLCFFTSA
jgi:hypothetical protein